MSRAAPNQPDRNERVRHVVEDVLNQRAKGAAVADAEILARHQDLLPELAQELAVLAILERAKEGSASKGETAGVQNAPAPAHTAPAGYSFIREIHRGGQGVVFEAIQNATGRRVAVKLRRAGVLADYREIERFEREVEILAQLEHPNIVRIIDTGVREADPFFVMDFVDGVPLDEYIASKTLSVADVVKLFAAIVRAVSEAHLRGVIHRDLKPANILVDQAGVPHLLDFGLARLAEQVDRSGATLTGQFIGSVPWASPEQAEGVQAGIDLRTDVYSLGVILFHMLTGAMPYECRGTLPEVISVIRNVRPARPSALRKQIDADLDTITLKCLAKEPERRYQSANELLEDLVRWGEHRPIAARPPSVVYQLRLFARRNRATFAAAVCVILAVLVGFAATYRQLKLTQRAERDAVKQKQEADASRKHAEWQSYRAAMSSVEAAFDLGDSRLLSDRLEVAPKEFRSWEWYHAQLRTSEDFRTLPPPTEGAESCEIASLKDGRMVVGDTVGRIRLLAAADRAPKWTTELHTVIENIVLAEDAQRVLVKCVKGFVLLNLNDGALIGWVGEKQEAAENASVHGGTPGSSVTVLAISPDASVAVMGPSDSKVLVRSLPDGKLSRELEFKSLVSFATYNHDGSLLAIAERGEIVLLDGHDFHEINRWQSVARDPNMPPHTLRFSEDGRFLAAGLGSILVVFDIPTGTPRHIFRVRHTLCDIAISPDLKRVAANDVVGGISVWQLDRAFFVRSILGAPMSGRRLCFLDDSTLASSSFRDPHIHIASVTEARAFQMIPAKGFLKTGFAPDSGSIRVASGSTIIERDLKTRQEQVRPLPQGIARVRAFDRSGHLAVCIDASGAVCVVNTSEGRTLWKDDQPAKGLVLAAFSDAQAGRMICTDGRSKVQVRSIENGTVSAEFDMPGIIALSIAANGEIAAMIESGGQGHLFSIADKSLSTFPTGLSQAWGATVSNDGKHAAFCGQGAAMMVDTVDPQHGRTVSLGDVAVMGLAFSPDATRLAAGGDLGTVVVLDTATMEPVLTLPNTGAAVNALVWSDDAESLAAASGAMTSTVFVWHGHFARGNQQPSANAWTKSR